MIHETAIAKSTLPDSVTVHPYVVIGEHVKMGENCVIHPFVVINDYVELGDNVEIFPGALIGKEPKGAGALARQPEFIKQLKIERDCSIGPHAVLYYDIIIGQNTLIGDGASIREKCVIGDYVVIGRYVTINYEVCLGDRTKVMDHAWLAGNMEVGKKVFISGGVLTANDNQIGKHGYHDAIKGPTICDGAKIGLGAMLLPSITVGENAIVAAGAVATKNVGENTLVKGIPAK